MPSDSGELLATAAPRAEPAAPAPPALPRLLYWDLLRAIPQDAGLEGWTARLSDAAALGISHMLLAPPFATPDIRLLGDPSVGHPLLGGGDGGALLARIDAACRRAGLGWFVDVRLDAVAADSALVHTDPGAFAPPDPATPLDPWNANPVARLASPERAAALLTPLLCGWLQAGAAGLRLSGLARFPRAIVRTMLTRLHEAREGALLIGVPDPGDEATASTWNGLGLDRVEAVIDLWDDRPSATTLEVAALARAAPLIAALERPFGRRLAAKLADRARFLDAAQRLVRVANALGNGWMMVEGFDAGATLRLDPRFGAAAPSTTPLPALVATIKDAVPSASGLSSPRAIPGLGPKLAGFRRGGGGREVVTLVNSDAQRAVEVSVPLLLAGHIAEDGPRVSVAPGGVVEVPLTGAPPIRVARPDRQNSAATAAASERIAIEAVMPTVDDGRFAAKRVAGEIISVTADLICDGHDKLAACVQWRPANETAWRETRMTLLNNDRWQASFVADRTGRFVFRVLAWRDRFASYRDEVGKKAAAGLNLRLEVMEGRALVAEAAARDAEVARLAPALDAADDAGRVSLLLSEPLAAAMAAADTRPFLSQTREYPIDADRPVAACAAWYEIFPRSMSGDVNRHGTFIDVIRHLGRIRDMGFDVLYFPPIHPIGKTNRKGRNNSLRAEPGEPGSPYAIGAAEGGHDAIHPELGTIEDFQRLRRAAAHVGLELAIDFAIQCSPDHPWLREHKGWFDWRPDGSLRYAENPPKKYEDIVNVDFYTADAVPALWVALADVVFFWLRQGVRIFRVDNPHTKPLPFWEWLIAEARAAFPDCVFLAEAFTKPKMMNRLGKIGFHQSYTYFTWRNTKAELQEYLTELSTGPQRDFFRPNFFVNTPDINPPFLQTGGRAAHLIRAALAATLSGSWGVYNGFELCEATPIPGREEYLDSEKYQLRAWDFARPGNIVAEITQLNQVRRLHPALWTHLGVTFLNTSDEQVMFYEKATPGREDVLLIAVSLDPFNAHNAAIELPLWRWGLPDQASLDCHDVLHEARFTLTGKWQRVALSPEAPYTIWHARPVV